MYYAREQAQLKKNQKRSTQLVKVFGEYGTTDLDDGELLRRDRGEELEVLLSLTLAANAAHCLRNNLSGSISSRQRGKECSARREGSSVREADDAGGGSETGSDGTCRGGSSSKTGGQHLPRVIEAN